MMKKILVFAKRYNKKSPNKIGGAIRLSEQLIDDLESLNESFSIIDINPSNYSGFFGAYLSIFYQALKKIKSHQFIFFNGSDRAFIIIVPILILFSKIFSKKIYLRKFGGSFDKYFEKASFFKKRVIKWSLKNATALFFETKNLVEYFSIFNKTIWFPNVRSISSKKIKNIEYKKRFVFISQVKKTKGILEILEASIKLNESYIIHIYGPIIDLKLSGPLENEFKRIYKGSLKPEEVLKTLSNYDVVLLPTFYKGEGYPGIIIEGYSLGKPVISTNWNSIPEIVVNNETGFLVSPRNSNELCQSIRSFNFDNYQDMSKKALKFSEQFDSIYQTKMKLKLIQGEE